MSCTAAQDPSAISFPGTDDPATPWRFYNDLIRQIPADILVRDYCLGTHWSYVQADCGMGVSFTCKGGGKRTHKLDLRGLPLRTVAELSKSWCFEEATLGVAALNAYFARPELLAPFNATYDDTEISDTRGSRGGVAPKDAFEQWRPEITQKGNQNVVVVGHFPNVTNIAEYANLTVLERACKDGWDTPDPACEYVVPQSNYTFITGVTIINKTAPRLLELAKAGTTVFVGPSVVMSPLLFDWDVDMLAGSVVADPEKVAFAVKNGAGQFFGEALQMTSIARQA